MRSMWARHSALRGDLGGECVASRTAVENTSICRPATAGMPNLACTISPCTCQALLQTSHTAGILAITPVVATRNSSPTDQQLLISENLCIHALLSCTRQERTVPESHLLVGPRSCTEASPSHSSWKHACGESLLDLCRSNDLLGDPERALHTARWLGLNGQV